MGEECSKWLLKMSGNTHTHLPSVTYIDPDSVPISAISNQYFISSLHHLTIIYQQGF